jgi:hypothetical protein
MATIQPGVTGRAPKQLVALTVTEPLTITILKACELSGFGPTTIWALLKDGQLEAVRVRGVRRTLITYQSLKKLLASSAEASAPRRQRRLRKASKPQENQRDDT